MSWEHELVKKLKGQKNTAPSFFIGTILQKSPFKISSLDGELIIFEGDKLYEATDFYSWRTSTEEEYLIGRKVLLIGSQKFVAITEVV